MGRTGHGEKQREGTRRHEIREVGRHVLARLPRVVSCPWIKAESKPHAGAQRMRRYERWGQASGAWFPSFLSQGQVQDDGVGGLLALASIHRLMTTGPDSRSSCPPCPPAADTPRRGPAGTYTHSENDLLPRHCGCGVLCPSEAECVYSRSYSDSGCPGPGPRLLGSVRRPPRPPRPPPGPRGSRQLGERRPQAGSSVRP